MDGAPVTPARLEAALQSLREPGRFAAAERLVAQAAPGLHRILVEAMASGGWSADDEARELDRALGAGGDEDVRAAVLGLMGEGSRVAMLVGVAVGFELADELRPGPAPDLTVLHHTTATEAP